MTTKIGGIVIDVDARLTKLEQSLKKADGDFKRFERNTTQSGKRIEQGVGGINKSFGALKGALAGAAIGFGIEGLYRLGRTAMQTGDDLVTAAERANISVERFQTLKEVFRIAEVDAEKFDKALARLNGTLGDVQRGVQDEATKALEQMGIQSRILSGEITTTDGLIDAIAASSKGFATEAQFTSAVVDIFGQKLGVELAPALLKGADGFGGLEQAVVDTGVVMSDFSANQLADANESVERFTTASSAKFTIWAASVIADINSVSLEWEGMQIRAAQGAGWFEQMSIMAFAPEKNVALAKGRRGVDNISKMSLGSILSQNGIGSGNSPLPKPPKATGGGGRRGGGGRSSGSSKGGLSEAQKLTQEYEKQVIANKRLLETTQLREDGESIAAETLERMWDIADKFPKLEAGKLEILKQQVRQLEAQSTFYQQMDEIQARWKDSPLTNALDADDVTKQLDALIAKNGFVSDKIGAQNVKIVKSFQDMANDTIAAVNQMSSAITGGGFLDIFGAVVGLGLQLGSIGAFGKKIQTNINSVPGKASGGYSPGGATMVGEYGPEMVNLPRGSQVVPNHRLGGG